MDTRTVMGIIQIFSGVLFIADYLFKGFFTIKVLKVDPHRVNRVLVFWAGILLVVIGIRTFYPGIFRL